MLTHLKPGGFTTDIERATLETTRRAPPQRPATAAADRQPQDDRWVRRLPPALVDREPRRHRALPRRAPLSPRDALRDPEAPAEEDDSGFTLAYESPNGIEIERVVSELTERGEALPFILIAHIVRELARAAAYAHREHALVLRAIRADNVLVAKDGRVLIATHRLGLGEPEHAPSWEDSGHLAPECLSRSEFGIASDVYALGTLLYALLTGKNAPPGSAVPLEELEDERVPEPLIGIVARATHPAKGERYRDALLLAAKLESWMAAQEGPPLTRQIVAAFFARYLI